MKLDSAWTERERNNGGYGRAWEMRRICSLPITVVMRRSTSLASLRGKGARQAAAAPASCRSSASAASMPPHLQTISETFGVGIG